jgi:hypothetical protein
MRATAFCHIEMAGELVALRVAVSSAMELALGRLPDETFWVEVVGELVAKFLKPEEQHSQVEWPSMRICDLLLGLPSGLARLADCLDKVVGQLGAVLAAWWEVDAELEALWTSATWVQDLVLHNVDGPSSLAASLSTVAELLEGRVDASAANGVRYGTRSALVTTLSHFLELEAGLELLGSKLNAVLTEEQVDVFWILACSTSASLVSHILPSVAHSPHEGMGE